MTLNTNKNTRNLFYIFSFVLLILVILDIVLQNSYMLREIHNLGFRDLNFKSIYFLDSFILFLSVVTFIFGLFVQKNWIVWTILALLLAPNIFVFVVFLGFSSLNIFKAIFSYFCVVMAWFIKLINLI